MEEVGVQIYDDIQYVKSSSFIADFGKHIVDIVFLCRYKSGKPRVIEPDELTSVEWKSTDEILGNEKIASWTKESIERAEQLKQKYFHKVN